MWALNNANKGATGAWDGWTTSGGNASRKFENFAFGRGASGHVNVYVSGYAGAAPEVVAKATVSVGASGKVIEKWLKVTVANGSGPSAPEAEPDPRRSLFAYGLLARDSIYANGGAWMDSYKSDPDNNPATPTVAWSSGVARSNARVAVSSTAAGALHVDGADIYGTAAVGSTTSAGLKMKDWDGQIGPRGASYSGKYRVTPGALAVDFSASFEPVSVPTGATVRVNYVLPRSVSGPPYYLSEESLGTTGASTVLQMNKLTVEGAATLTIKGDVTLYLPPAGSETLKVAGSGKMLLASGATLKIITPGNISVSGAGIANSGAPENVQIWGNAADGSAQTISLSGSGALSAVLYAPNAALTLPGHTDFSGAAVVKSARLTGSGAFHYDESLEYFTGSAVTPTETEETTVSTGGAAAEVTIQSFVELDTPSAREPYLAVLGF